MILKNRFRVIIFALTFITVVTSACSDRDNSEQTENRTEHMGDAVEHRDMDTAAVGDQQPDNPQTVGGAIPGAADAQELAEPEEPDPVVLTGDSPQVNEDGTLPAKIYVALLTDEHRKYELDLGGRCIIPCVGKRVISQKIVENYLEFKVEQLFLENETSISLGSFRVANIELAEQEGATTVEVEIEVHVGEDGSIGVRSRDRKKNLVLDVESL